MSFEGGEGLFLQSSIKTPHLFTENILFARTLHYFSFLLLFIIVFWVPDSLHFSDPVVPDPLQIRIRNMD
jgi:hypothetical protein